MTKSDRAGKPAAPKWELKLYVAGQTAKSLQAFSNLKHICEVHLDGEYHIEVIDLLKNPQLAKGDQILALPTLVRKLPARPGRLACRTKPTISARSIRRR